jgi:nitroreductase
MPDAKLANRPAGLNSLLRDRWSPRAFADSPINGDIVTRLLEAVQWAMSCFNGQPWRIVYATKEDATSYERILATLVPQNQTWAKTAPMIGIAIARTHFEHNGAPNATAEYDTGAAMALLTVQAQAEGLHVHQMAGFDGAKAREALSIPEGYTPMAAFVVGYMGNADTLPEPLRERELQPGQRKPLSEIAFQGIWPNELGP